MLALPASTAFALGKQQIGDRALDLVVALALSRALLRCERWFRAKAGLIARASAGALQGSATTEGRSAILLIGNVESKNR